MNLLKTPKSPEDISVSRASVYKRRRLPTLPHCCAVPSAQVGLTFLCSEWEEVGHHRNNHLISLSLLTVICLPFHDNRSAFPWQSIISLLTFVNQAYDNRLSFFWQSLIFPRMISCHFIESVLSFHQNQTPLRCEGMGDLSPQARTEGCNILFSPLYKDRRNAIQLKARAYIPKKVSGN